MITDQSRGCGSTKTLRSQRPNVPPGRASPDWKIAIFLFTFDSLIEFARIERKKMIDHSELGDFLSTPAFLHAKYVKPPEPSFLKNWLRLFLELANSVHGKRKK